MFKLAVVILLGVASVFGQDPVECVQGRFGTDTGNNYFDHSLNYYNNANITAIQIYHSEFIHGLNVAYGGVYAGLVGSAPITAARSEVVVPAGQRIDRIDIRSGIYIDQLTFYIDGVPSIRFGGFGGDLVQLTYCGHLYFKGNAASYLDRLNIYTECTYCE